MKCAAALKRQQSGFYSFSPVSLLVKARVKSNLDNLTSLRNYNEQNSLP